MNVTIQCDFCDDKVDVVDDKSLYRTREGAKIRQGRYREQGYDVYRLYFNNVLEHTCRQRAKTMDEQFIEAVEQL